MKKKLCKSCRVFVEGELCTLCNGNQFATSWQGRLNIINAEKSEIAQKTGIAANGEYAIKVR